MSYDCLKKFKLDFSLLWLAKKKVRLFFYRENSIFHEFGPKFPGKDCLEGSKTTFLIETKSPV